MRKTENTRVHVPAHEVSEGFVPLQDFHVERCPPTKLRRRGPRSLRALMRREMHRFTPSAGAPGKSGAVLLAGTPADVLNSDPFYIVAEKFNSHCLLGNRLRIQMVVCAVCVNPKL